MFAPGFGNAAMLRQHPRRGKREDRDAEDKQSLRMIL
jgi:hypothetical protein